MCQKKISSDTGDCTVHRCPFLSSLLLSFNLLQYWPRSTVSARKTVPYILIQANFIILVGEGATRPSGASYRNSLSLASFSRESSQADRNIGLCNGYESFLIFCNIFTSFTPTRVQSVARDTSSTRRARYLKFKGIAALFLESEWSQPQLRSRMRAKEVGAFKLQRLYFRARCAMCRDISTLVCWLCEQKRHRITVPGNTVYSIRAYSSPHLRVLPKPNLT